MADKQISDLTAATGLTDSSLFVLEQSGTAKKATWGLMKGYISPNVVPQYSVGATYKVGDYVVYNDEVYRCIVTIATPESWTAAHWTRASIASDVGNIGNAMGDVYNKCDLASIVARFPANVTQNGSTLSFTSQASGSNYVCVYVPIEPDTTYDFSIGNYTNLDNYGYKLTDTISASWNPGGFTQAGSGTVTNVSNAYLALLVVAWSTYTGDISLTVRQHFETPIVKQVKSVRDTVGDLDNLFFAEHCTVTARYIDYVEMVGHSLVVSSNSSGSNYINVYVPLKFGAFYTIDYGDTSSLQVYGAKLATSIVAASNQGFTTFTSFRNDGTDNAYLVLLAQVINTFAGPISFTVKKDTSKGLVARVGTGYAYTSILNALKNTIDDVELLLVDNEYDIQQEYTDYYGASFWTDYAGYTGQTDYFYTGLWLTGNRKIRGTGNATLKMLYTGNNNYVNTDFSVFAFYPQASSVEISNFTIKFSGIRYAIHDDFVPQHSTIKMSGIIFDGSSYTAAVIGAGLGIDTLYLIDNCVFLNNTKMYDISYHGSTNALQTNKCKLIVSNCFGSKACAFRWYGASTAVTDCIVNNSKFGSIVCQEYDSSQTNVNMRLIEYCNVVS